MPELGLAERETERVKACVVMATILEILEILPAASVVLMAK